jgi:hypothetical protein
MTLSASQLAFITKEERVSDARKKMIFAWCKEKNLPVPALDKKYIDAEWEKKQMKNLDTYPILMDIGMLSRQLDIPNLLTAAEDIKHNYLKRTATRQWIIEYPQDIINKKQCIPERIIIPNPLRGLLSSETIAEVITIWKKRYGHLKSLNEEPIKFE